MFRFRWLCTVGLAVSLSACGGKTPSAPSPVPAGQPAPQPGADATFLLSGTVRDYSGRTLGDAVVSVSGEANPSLRLKLTRTDGAGHYQFQGISGRITVTATAVGLNNDFRRLSITSNTIQDLELETPLRGIVAGESITAELHAGPHSSVCSNFDALRAQTQYGTCRVISVRVDHPGTLKASLDWPNTRGLALSEPVDSIFGLPHYTPTVCCAPGMVLSVRQSAAGTVTLIVWLEETAIAPVTFTLHTSLEP